MDQGYFTKEDTPITNKCMKRCLILNIIKKLKIKNTRYYYALLGQNQEHCQQHITTHWQGCGATGTLIHC